MSLKVDKITITYALFGIFGLWRNFFSLKYIQEIQNEDPFTVDKLSKITLMEEFKPIVMWSYEFEHQDLPKVVTFVAGFDNRDLTEEIKIMIFLFNSPSQVKPDPIDSALDGRNQTNIY